MTLSAFGYGVLAMLVCAPASAVVAFGFLYRQRLLRAVDFATIALPPFGFILVGYFRPVLHVGWAMLLWPILIAVSSMYLFAAAALLRAKLANSSARISLAVLAVCVLVSVVLGATVPPWYD